MKAKVGGGLTITTSDGEEHIYLKAKVHGSGVRLALVIDVDDELSDDHIATVIQVAVQQASFAL